MRDKSSSVLKSESAKTELQYEPYSVFRGEKEEMEPQQRLTLPHMAYFVLFISGQGVNNIIIHTVFNNAYLKNVYTF